MKTIPKPTSEGKYRWIKPILDKKIKVLDNTAITLCVNNDLPILVIKLSEKDGLKKKKLFKL